MKINPATAVESEYESNYEMMKDVIEAYTYEEVEEEHMEVINDTLEELKFGLFEKASKAPHGDEIQVRAMAALLTMREFLENIKYQATSKLVAEQRKEA